MHNTTSGQEKAGVGQPLGDLVAEHLAQERVSFHTPGHKGHSWQADGAFVTDWRSQEDLTELPGLDELSNPEGVLSDLEQRAARAWGAQSTIISVNGASAGIIAAMLMLSKYGTHILLPRNCHRSVINGLTLSGLEPIWFEPVWHDDWGLWGSVDTDKLAKIIENVATVEGNNEIKIADCLLLVQLMQEL